MITADRLDGLMDDWFQSTAPMSAPSDLHDRAMERARHIRQGSGWVAVLRRARAGRLVPVARRIGYVAVLVALAAALLAALAAGAFFLNSNPQGKSNGLIAYTVGRNAVAGGPNGDVELTAVHVTDGAQDRVIALDGRPSSCASFSPDGQRIAFWSDVGERGLQFVLGSADGRNLASVPGATVSSAFAPDAPPAWSPDGQLLAFVPWAGAAGGTQIAVVDVNTKAMTMLLPDLGRIQTPRWSPDGQRIAFVAAGRTIVVADRDGTQAQAIVSADEIELGDWSPDGQWLLYNAIAGSKTRSDIFIVGADGTDQRRLSDNVRGDRFPAWSPDSQLVAYITGDSFAADVGYTISVVDIDGSGRRSLSPNGGDLGSDTYWSLEWSPDGKRVVVFAYAADDDALGTGTGEIVSLSVEDPADQVVLVPRRDQLFGTCGLAWQSLTSPR